MKKDPQREKLPRVIVFQSNEIGIIFQKALSVADIKCYFKT